MYVCIVCIVQVCRVCTYTHSRNLAGSSHVLGMQSQVYISEKNMIFFPTDSMLLLTHIAISEVYLRIQRMNFECGELQGKVHTSWDE